ncbi:hypothetical protein FQN50_008720 [Emmonsiellopsis sp. PD_5]|nr:hypothetical protein FQN50_008720 [Emmonsiellopsis sp. PD_5]
MALSNVEADIEDLTAIVKTLRGFCVSTHQPLVAIEKGMDLCKKLRTFDADQPEYESMHNLYRVSCDMLRRNTQVTIQTALASCGRSISDLVFVEAHSPVPRDAAYNNYIDGKNGVIICNENYKSRDQNPAGKKLWPSEVLWQSWKMVAKRQQANPSNLRVIVRYVIVEECTQRVIWQAHRASGSGPESYREYTEFDEGYYAILGSTNGASTMRMLIDHKRDIGYRTVDKVIVLPDAAFTSEEPKSQSFMIVLSGPRASPAQIFRSSGAMPAIARLNIAFLPSWSPARFTMTSARLPATPRPLQKSTHLPTFYRRARRRQR